MAIRLHVTDAEIDAPEPEKTLEFAQGPVLLGRSKTNHVVFGGPLVSRVHFELHEREGGWVVLARGSLLPTILNGAQLERERQHQLAEGDRIVVGGFSVEISLPQPVPAEGAPVSSGVWKATPQESTWVEGRDQGDWRRPKRTWLEIVVESGVSAAAGSVRLPLLEEGREYVLGRSSDCDLSLQHGAVSRRHLKLRREGGEVLLTDLGSKNPARLNGVPLRGVVRMHVGSLLQIGPLRLTLVEAGGAPPAAGRSDPMSDTALWSSQAIIPSAGSAAPPPQAPQTPPPHAPREPPRAPAAPGPPSVPSGVAAPEQREPRQPRPGSAPADEYAMTEPIHVSRPAPERPAPVPPVPPAPQRPPTAPVPPAQPRSPVAHVPPSPPHPPPPPAAPRPPSPPPTAPPPPPRPQAPPSPPPPPARPAPMASPSDATAPYHGPVGAAPQATGRALDPSAPQQPRVSPDRLRDTILTPPGSPPPLPAPDAMRESITDVVPPFEVPAPEPMAPPPAAPPPHPEGDTSTERLAGLFADPVRVYAPRPAVPVWVFIVLALLVIGAAVAVWSALR